MINVLATAMPRFFFDLYDGIGFVLDEEGQQFETKQLARNEALRILHDVARAEMPDHELVKITVKVRGETGAQVFEASLILSSGWSL